MELLNARRIYMIGVKGAGMTALAEFLIHQGVSITGSDTDEVFFTDAVLARLGVRVLSPFRADQIDVLSDVCIYSTAYTQENNEEMRAFAATGKPMFSYPEALGVLTASKMTLAVCGTHGKTTTSALLGQALQDAGTQPSAIVGSEIKSWGGGALAGQGPYLVLEADEYQDKLRFYTPFGIILTSVDWDHPDYFPTVDAYEAVFQKFIARLPRHGFLVAWGDDARVRAVTQSFTGKKIFYGFLPENDIRILEAKPIDPESAEGQQGIRQHCTLAVGTEDSKELQLTLTGRHNVLNAAAVASVFIQLKLPIESLQKTLATFQGTKRRFEFLGTVHDALIYDDYAHHPEEIRATLTAFRELYPKRTLSVIFHPHTFTRTKALLTDFAETLSLADRVYLLDIYGSARETQGGVTSQDVVDRINTVWPGKAEYVPDRKQLTHELKQKVTNQDLIVTMGAGDVWQVATALLV